MLTKMTELVTGIQHLIHLLKPMLFDMVIFVWAAYEMGRFLLIQVGVVAQ